MSNNPKMSLKMSKNSLINTLFSHRNGPETKRPSELLMLSEHYKSKLVRVLSPSGSTNQPFGRHSSLKSPTNTMTLGKHFASYRNATQIQAKTMNSERDTIDLTISLYYKEQKQVSSTQRHVITIGLQETTTDLYKKLILKMNSINSSIVPYIKHFQTTSHNKDLSIDYYLTLENEPLEVFSDIRHIKLEPLIITQTDTKLSIDSFTILKCIGVGGFSRVYLVRKNDTGLFYAMKLIDKQFIVNTNKQVIIQNERYVMEFQDSPYLAKLFYAFETKYYLVFVMEYCQGGELFYHLRKQRRLTEQLAQQYFVQVCLAVGYLHSKGIVYRDIKPENILLDLDGYIRLSDFGLAKPNMSREDTAYSFCGSPEYMSPEMLLREGHNYLVDVYCLGALLYEFVCGSPPFYSRNIDSIYNSILNEEVTFPSNVSISDDLKDLICKLLVKEPAERLGSIKGIEDILTHKWFKKFDIGALKDRQLNLSYKPLPLKYNFDEAEFSKGDDEFRIKLQDNIYREKQSRFQKCFVNFDYANKNFVDTRQNLLNQILKRLNNKLTPQKTKTLTLNSSPNRAGMGSPQIQSVKGSSNVSGMLAQSFRNMSNGKRFTTEVDIQKYVKAI